MSFFVNLLGVLYNQLFGPKGKVSKRRLVSSPSKVRKVEKKVDESWAKGWLDERIASSMNLHPKPSSKSHGKGQSAMNDGFHNVAEPCNVSMLHELPYDETNWTDGGVDGIPYDLDNSYDSPNGVTNGMAWVNGGNVLSNGQAYRMSFRDETNDPDEPYFDNAFICMDGQNDSEELPDLDEPYDEPEQPCGYDDESYDPGVSHGRTVDGMTNQPDGGNLVPIEMDKAFVSDLCPENIQDDMVYVDGTKNETHFLNILKSGHQGLLEYRLVSVVNLTVPQGETLMSFQNVLAGKRWTQIALSANGSIGIEYGTNET